MNKLYNTQGDLASKIRNFLLECFPNIRKTQLKIIPFIVVGMILSMSVVASDIAKKLKDEFSLIQPESVIKRIKRFFCNKLFNPYLFYDLVIRHVISNYKKKHKDRRVHIIFDHMFSHDNYTVFMITLRIGTQGIPLWFRCFKGNNDPQAFQEELIKEGISYVSSLFDPSFDLIFLADRWFNSTSVLKHIDSLGHTYCIRLKGNLKITYLDKKGELVTSLLSEVASYQYHSKFLEDIEITENKFRTNITISKREGVSEPWIIVTNGDVKRAIKDYGYRFGGIETIFKNQKSNGFYLENVVNASLKYFTSMYTILCFSVLILTIMGADYSKNTKCYKNLKLKTHKQSKGKKIRIMSLFNIGLTIFNTAYNSLQYIRVPTSFILYDV